MIQLSTICRRILVCAVAVMSFAGQAAPVVVTNFTFPAQTGVALNTLVTSAQTGALSGMGGAGGYSVTISPAGATFKINNGAYGTTGNVSDTDKLTIQVTSSPLYNTNIPVIITIGAPINASATFNVTTGAASPTGVSFTQIDNVQPSSVQTSNQVTIAGLAIANVPFTIAGGTYSIDTGGGPGPFISTAGTVNNGDKLVLQLTASSSYSMLSQALLTIGGAPFYFNVTTMQTPGVPVTLPSLPISIPGTSSTPAIGNLGTGSGPNVASGVTSVLTGALGTPLRYISQSAQGTATLSGYNGGNLAFMPLLSQTTDSRVNGVYAVGNGQYQVVFNGYSNTIAPALVHLDQLLALLPGVVASQLDNGVIVATYNGVTYAVQPSVQVQVGPATGAASLFLGNDGLYRFIDAQGNAQVLYPAFADVTTLRGSVAPNMLAAGSATIQLDGTARLVGSGQSYTLGADYTLGGVPAANAGQIVWQEAAQRYRMANASASVAGSSQGFNVGP